MSITRGANHVWENAIPDGTCYCLGAPVDRGVMHLLVCMDK